MSRPRKLPCSIADERSELVQAALTYHRLGLCVIPVRTGTKVAQSWKRYQAERPSEATIRRWFASGSSNSVPFVMGPVSGGLICRDFDDLTAYERWAAQFPQLAQTLPTVETGGGGRHVYAKADSSQIGEFDRAYLKFDDGELRLRSCYCVAAPSSHPDGGTYRWIIPLGSDIPAIDIRSAGFTQQYTAGATESNREHRDNGALQRQLKNTETTDAIESGCVKVAPMTIERAIAESLPKAPGKRNKLVFELARCLKAVPELTDAPLSELTPYVRKWYELAKPVIRTQPFEETWIDFLRAWPRVKFPKGSEPIRAIFDAARASELPEVAHRYEHAPIRLLVALCRELQRVAGDGPFYLSCRTAGKLLGVDHATAWRWLFLLKSDGVLVTTEAGSQQTRKATRYRYLGG